MTSPPTNPHPSLSYLLPMVLVPNSLANIKAIYFIFPSIPDSWNTVLSLSIRDAK